MVSVLRCAGLAAQPDLGAARDLEALREAYTPGAPRFRFQHLLLNVVDAPGARAKPPGVDELRWREALQVCKPCHKPVGCPASCASGSRFECA